MKESQRCDTPTRHRLSSNQKYLPSLRGVVFKSCGNLLRGIFFQGKGMGPRPTLLLLHGVPGTEQNVDIARAIFRQGWNALIFHYRGSWGSEGTYSLLNMMDDIAAAARFLREEPVVDPHRMAIAGLSMGGWGAIAYASQDPDFHSVVAIAPLVNPAQAPLSQGHAREFTSMLSGISEQEILEEWKQLQPLAPLAPKLQTRDILLITAGRDEFFRPDHFSPLMAAMPWIERKHYPKADHTFLLYRQSLVRCVVSWLMKHNGNREQERS